ncbi:BREX-1 system adenine-specific DNA-methyltransferase PglX [Radiobacillus sp. PE A8.2]|uniref:BREX-1 system adenine-specific DNA-methyltransferase PglX n=1 Tax=Radiobacillus sp. PE A8.2 TaxID=3380349 RepID=UPI0038903A34
MNKAELKKFAVEARRDLIDKVSLKAEQYGITKDNQVMKIEEKYGQLFVSDNPYPIESKHAFHMLQQRLDAVGYDQIIEEVAYTWFNRIIAIRYMEVNNYLPDRVNVLSSSTGKNEPDILLQYKTMDLDVNYQQITKDIQKGDNEQAYRRLFVTQCNSLNKSLSTLFEKINDYTEFLLPDYLLDSEFVISKLVANEELTDSFKEVEVIGWLYQYYNAEPKDEVFAKLRKNKKAEKSEIPAATQFFTPKWIVQYMVENSLGQLWQEANPETQIKNSLKYYIKPVEQDNKVAKKLEEIRYKSINLEEITIIDPCVGSGHILVYAFDLLYQMYEEVGYLSRDIPKLILEKNLYGLDIDERATQMASFALMMKAREKSRRILRQNVKTNILSIEESNDLDLEGLISLLANNKQEGKEIESIINLYQDAQNFGSMIIPPLNIDYKKFLNRIGSIGEVQTSFNTINGYAQLDKMKKILIQSQILGSKYDVAITNPPYMGNRGMNSSLKEFVMKLYPQSKSDLYAVFIERLQYFTKTYGINSTVTQHSWMFISSFEEFRNQIIKNQTLLSLIHLGTRAFDDIGGEVVQTSSQTFRNFNEVNYIGGYVRLVDYQNSTLKKEKILSDKDRYNKPIIHFKNIPGSPIAYWINPQQLEAFKKDRLEKHAAACTGMQTGSNSLFTRNWYEVNFTKTNIKEPIDLKWFKYNEGGESRKWYGNHIGVVNWENNGSAIKNHKSSVVRNEQYYFKEGITWKRIGSGNLALRYLPSGFIFDQSGDSLFVNTDENLYYILGFFNSKVAQSFKQILAPTMNLTAGNIKFFPIIFPDNETKEEITAKVLENIMISKQHWDSLEISWDFDKNVLLSYKEDKKFIEESFTKWNDQTKKDISKLKNNEERLNQLFIKLYKLDNELTSEVSRDDISIELTDQEINAKSFLSYFIGCTMGRYSLDINGLIYAGGEFVEEKYSKFKPNKDGIIQLTDDYYFDSDIIVRLREFLSVAFSPDTIDENMRWLSESLNMKKNESPEERIRRYFLDEFFNDHCKTYRKRPIYWLVDSGKQKGLRTLIYMHRYQPDTMATIRFEHLQEIQSKYQNEIDMIDTRLSNPRLSASDKRSLEKFKSVYQKKIEELQEFDKKLATYANKQIGIDLDDGVNVNYAQFENVLAKIK